VPGWIIASGARQLRSASEPGRGRHAILRDRGRLRSSALSHEVFVTQVEVPVGSSGFFRVGDFVEFSNKTDSPRSASRAGIDHAKRSGDNYHNRSGPLHDRSGGTLRSIVRQSESESLFETETMAAARLERKSGLRLRAHIVSAAAFQGDNRRGTNVPSVTMLPVTCHMLSVTMLRHHVACLSPLCLSPCCQAGSQPRQKGPLRGSSHRAPQPAEAKFWQAALASTPAPALRNPGRRSCGAWPSGSVRKLGNGTMARKRLTIST